MMIGRTAAGAMFVVMGLWALVGGVAVAAPMTVTLAEDGRPAATIVVGKDPAPAATLAALELQHHIHLVTAAELPIKTCGERIEGPVLLVGESAATQALGLDSRDFQEQEYLIQFFDGGIVLMGRDWRDTPANRNEQGRGTNWGTTLEAWRQEIDYAAATGQEDGPKKSAGHPPRKRGPPSTVVLPGLFDDQGTCYAVYDFLERFCSVRWYGPSPINMVFPRSVTLTVTGDTIRRAPALKYREGIGGGWPIVKAQWDDPTPDQLNLYWRRMREGGEKWGGNHSFMSYQDRFLRKNPEHPELFEKAHPEYFAQGQTGGPGALQFCYTNPAFIRQVAKDARDYFDGKGLKGYQVAMGDYFAVVPLDNARWCTCKRCQALLARDKDNIRGKHFNSGTATHYLFGFVNAVAEKVAKTHPDKFITTLAYHVYAYPPEDFTLAPNVAVAPCLHGRHQWAPNIQANEHDLYEKWVAQKDRRIYLWNYYCFPMEPAVSQGWHCFPGFSAHALARRIKMFHRDGVRGIFLCGIGEQVDFYLTMKLYDDPSLDADGLLDEFFTRYFGAAAGPMKAFYERIEDIYSDPANYPERIRTKDWQFHQTEVIAWRYLGTEERMKELGALKDQAQALAATDEEKRRVGLWERGVWEYMVEGRKQYLVEGGR